MKDSGDVSSHKTPRLATISASETAGDSKSAPSEETTTAAPAG